MAKHKVMPMSRMLFRAERPSAPPDSWWAGCDRATFHARLAQRLKHMQPATPSDLVYGPHRGGSGYSSLPVVKEA